MWFSLSRGNFGLTLKPNLMQVMFKEKENVFEECLLDSDENDEEKVEPIALNNPDSGFDENDDSD